MPPQPAVEKVEALDGHIRLATDIVIPVRYDLALRMDPRTDRFSGEVSIQIQILAPTSRVLLHGGDLTIDAASIETDQRREVSVVQGENGGMALDSEVVLEPGLGTIHLSFSAELGEVPESLYRVKEGDLWYAYTQFEPLEARDAFPSFDDPGFKTPYSVTLTVPTGMTALANTPETGRVDDGDWTEFTFAESKPLPTYLVAFAVGEFDIVEAKETIGQDGVPLRIVTTKGKGHLTEFVLATTPAILASLEAYFGSPYPFEKLDLVAVPNFSAGAMENVGLVTYREALLLFESGSPPVRSQYRCISVNAHELAHMWFGNLVTPAWWDDLWLNEAFATWMASRTVADVAPGLQADLDAVARANGVMDTDSQKATRAIRQPIEHGGDVYNAFDGITYAKGASVLAMVEAWIGEDAFRDGVRAYLVQSAYGTGYTDGLLDSLEEVSGKPVRAMITNFLDQPGTPLLEIDIRCEEGGVFVDVAQSRYLPSGSDAPQGEPWRVPVCMRFEADGQVRRLCVDLDAKEKTFSLETQSCPTWLHPNADERGYYRWKLSSERMVGLVGEHRGALSLRERVALPQHMSALLQADAVSPEVYLDANKALAAEEHRLIVGSVIGNLDFIERRVISDEARPAFQAYVRRVLAPHLRRVGLNPVAEEAPEIGLLRPRLISALIRKGDDKKLRHKMRTRAAAFMKDPSQVPPDIARLAMGVLAEAGDAELWEQVKAGVLAAETPAMRRIYLRALGGFHNPALATRSFDLLLDGTLRGQDYWSVIGPAFATDDTHRALWTWVTTNYDKIIESLGDKRARSIPWAASGFCSEEGLKETEDFFANPGRTPAGTERNLSMVKEGIARCTRLKKSLAPGVEKYFR
jgi:alanyl aminopeptidase